jgi:SAM-dependent methyltransferase
MAAPEPNAEQIRYWNESAGPKWVAFQQVIDAQIRPLGHRAMERADIAPGERVIDVGCGCGDTTITLGERVGSAGRVLGIDVSAPMLARAAELARAVGLANVRFENADAQTHRFPPGAFDVVYSRFGSMFFADPVAAFANLRAALRPGGRLAFVCWQALPENPWLFVPLRAAAEHLTLPPPPAPDAPGPFAFADPERVRGILARASFARIAFEDVRTTLTLGGGGAIEAAVRFLTEGVGPVSGVLREADPALRPAVVAAVRAAITPFHGPQGVRMDSAAWIVTALSAAP